MVFRWLRNWIISVVVDDIMRNGRIRRALEKAQEQTKGRVCDR